MVSPLYVCDKMIFKSILGMNKIKIARIIIVEKIRKEEE